jgi:hypothetical protein
MNELRRIFLCALSLGLACAVFWVSGAGLPGYRTFHKWYFGCVAVFLPILMAMMAIALRGRLERSAWPIIVGALSGWIAASLAYLIYFEFSIGGLFKNPAWHPFVQRIEIIIFLPPVVTLSPLFGALSGAFFALSQYFVAAQRQCEVTQHSRSRAG